MADRKKTEVPRASEPVTGLGEYGMRKGSPWKRRVSSGGEISLEPPRSHSDRTPILPIAPIPVFLALFLLLAVLDIRTVFEPSWLLPTLNTVFLLIVPLAAVYIATRGYIQSGFITLLMLGAGTLAFGLGALLAGYVLGLGGPNANVTVYNVSALVSGVFHALGAVLAFIGLDSQRDARRKKLSVTLIYLGTSVLLALLAIATLKSLIPVFFVQGEGPTALRQTVLGTAIVLFVVAGLLFCGLYLFSRSRLLYWYFLALFLIATGLTCVLFQKSVGSPLGWLGRGSQYLGGIYLLVAVVSAWKELRVKGLNMKGGIADLFRHRLSILVEERTSQLRRANEQLSNEVAERKKAEDALHESEHMLRTILSTSPIGIALTKNRSIEWANDVWKQMFGYEDEQEYLNRDARMLYLSDEEYEHAGKVLYHDLQTGKVGETDTKFRRKDGSVFDAHVKIKALDPLDPATGAISAISDISFRKRAEETLQASEAFLNSVIDQSPYPMWISDHQGTLERANKALCDLLHITNEEVVGKYNILRDNIVEEQGVLPLVKSVFEQGATARFEIKYDTPQLKHLQLSRQAFVVLDVTIFPIKNSRGEVTNAVIQHMDITERKRAEEAHLLLAAIVECSDDGIIGATLDGIITSWNKGAANIYGYKDTEVVGKPTSILAPPERRDEVRELLDRIERGKHVERYETVRRRKDGREIDVSLTISPIRNAEGAIIGVSTTTRDITGQKSLQRQLLQAQKMEAIGTLAGGVAHDFNNLLTVVMGFSELLLAQKQEDDREYADLQRIFHAAKNGAELVQRLLMFSRKSEPTPRPMNLNMRIVEVEKLLRRTIPMMVDIDLALSADLPEINADSSQIEQVLMNLAVNARDAMQNGGKLTVRTSRVILDEEYPELHVEASPGEYVVLEVSDTGHGMDKETVEHIFEPFFTTKEKGQGTGLGLAMVHGIVKQHNGFLTVYSEVGIGATFRVYLPAIQREVESDLEATVTMPAVGTETVLLVDDEELVRELGARILTKHGYTVLQAENGKVGLDLFKAERTRLSLVILDLIMPTMGGKECLKELLKLDPNVKVLVASGYSADSSVREAVQMGAKGFVAKPFRVKELLRDVRRVLDKS